MQLGYHTGGLTQHEIFSGLNLLADIGYQSVAISIDFGWLSPSDHDVHESVQRVRAELKARKMTSVVEATANYLLDANRPNWPTLMETDPGLVEARMRYLKYCVDVASELGSVCMSLRSGPKPEGVTFDDAMNRLVEGLFEVLQYAAEQDVQLAVEPEPGMLIDTLGRYERLLHLLDSPRLGLTMDVGHVFFSNELPFDSQVEKWIEKMVNVHIEDIHGRQHRHLPPGAGSINFELIMESLVRNGYAGPVHVDLNEHAHVGPEMARQCHGQLLPMIQKAIRCRGEIS